MTQGKLTVKQWWKIDAALRAEWWQAERTKDHEEQQRVRAALDAHAEVYPA